MPAETTPTTTPAPTANPSLREKLTATVEQHLSGTPAPVEPAIAPAPEPVKAPEPKQAAPTVASAAPATPVVKATPEPPKEPKGIKELREAYDRQVTKATEIAADRDATAKEKAAAFAKASDLETRLTAREQEIEKDYKPRVARLEKAEKELQQYHEAMRVRDYMATPEFHEKFVKPIADARTEVGDLMAQMVVTDANGNARAATAQDFDVVLASRSLNEAAAKSRDMFGPDLSHVVMQFVTRIGSLDRARHEAVKNSNLQAMEWEKRQQSTVAQHREQLRNQLLSKSEAYLQPFRSEDPEETAALQEGLKLADQAMGADPSLTPDQFIDAVARSRADISAKRVLEKQNTKLRKELDEAREQLKGYQKSEPTVETRTSGAPVTQPRNLRAELEAKFDEMARR